MQIILLLSSGWIERINSIFRDRKVTSHDMSVTTQTSKVYKWRATTKTAISIRLSYSFFLIISSQVRLKNKSKDQ